MGSSTSKPATKALGSSTSEPAPEKTTLCLVPSPPLQSFPTPSVPDVEIEWSLPPEILEMILKKLPARDVVLCSAVATIWRRAVASELSLSRKVALERAWRFGDVEPKICYNHHLNTHCAAKSSSLVAMAGRHGIQLVDLNNQEMLLDHPRQDVGSVHSVGFFKHLLLAGNEEGLLFGWDVISKIRMVEMRVCEGPVFALVGFEGQIAVGGRSGYLAIISIDDQRPKTILHGHENRITCLAVEQEEKVLISGSWDKTVRVWDLTKDACIHVLRGHNDAVESLGVGGDTVISGSYDSSLCLWSLKSGACLSKLFPHAWCNLAIGSCNSHFFSGSYSREIKIWDSGGSFLRTLKTKGSCVRNGVWGDNERLVCVSALGDITEWDFSKAIH
ncbi:hypothetical protein BSKO_04508 [Bryopsis sp. KO-2023]|nr:hypothetical protein BSKO_04508 [Bryopsis sp. KO-2023]